MRLMNWFIQGITMAACLFALLRPESKWGFPLMLVCFAAVGIWAMLFPQGPLSWVKGLRERADDPALWPLPRAIGGIFVGFAIIGATLFLFVR